MRNPLQRTLVKLALRRLIASPAGSKPLSGALATNMEIRPQQSLVLKSMVPYAGYPLDGNEAHESFRKCVLGRFGKK